MHYLELSLKPGVAILFLVLFVLAAAAAIFFLYRGVKRERIAFAESKLTGGKLDRDSFDAMLRKRFAAATRHSRFHVFQIELGDAKSMKESFGDLQYGNALRVLSARFEKIFPAGTKICAYAYDTIMVFLDGEFGNKELSEFASFCILEGKKTIEMVAGLAVEFDLNIGIASYNAFNSTYEMFRQNLELALVVSKRSGVNQFTVHTAELSNRESEEYKYYQEIKEAIENNEFTLYYQPIVDLQTGATYGYESLLRWNHRTLGVLSPDKFLNIIEQSGDINWVGLWAYEQLLRQHTAWKLLHPQRRLILSMNLSPKQLMNEHLVDDMRRVLRKYRVEPSEICMEIVEFALFDKMDVIKENIQKLTQAGFLIAIDDYGLEFNTLQHLEQMHVDMIKLDRAFIDKAKENFLTGGIVNMLISYAEKNNTMIVAEGIEDAAMVEFVRGLRIPLGQGYFFGKPQDPSAYEKD